MAIGCKQKDNLNLIKNNQGQNTIKKAKGFELYKYDGFSILKIKNPWPKSIQDYTYILQEKNGIIPDSLKTNPIIPVPIKTIIVTSTTHIPSLEMLGVENTLVGFPNLDYISSQKVRRLIDAEKVKELGTNQSLNIETTIDLSPSVIIGFGIDNHNPALDNLQKSGLKVILNGDWNEQTPLGKAEWIKFFGVLYDKEILAQELYEKIENEYNETVVIAQKATFKPTVISGALYEDVWYLPYGNSWSSLFLKEAQTNYIWAKTNGTGSLSLPFEKVYEMGKDADLWIGPGQFSSLEEIIKTNPHYGQFKAFKRKNVYSYSSKKGKTGGVLFYELAPNRPDLVLKDILKIAHPELLPEYELFFYEKLK
jgi:iron complex transport system substrate-binding protein